MALLDRGLTGREINGNTPVIYLLNAVDQYHKFENLWTTGKGRHLCEYALLPHDQPSKSCRIPTRAWEYSQPPIMLVEAGDGDEVPILETSGNIVVEALRREGDQIELRFAEVLGVPGPATVKLNLPQQRCTHQLGKQSPAEAGRQRLLHCRSEAAGDYHHAFQNRSRAH